MSSISGRRRLRFGLAADPAVPFVLVPGWNTDSRTTLPKKAASVNALRAFMIVVLCQSTWQSSREYPFGRQELSCFPGAHSQAESLDELQANLREVIAMLLEDGEPRLEAEFVGTQSIAVA